MKRRLAIFATVLSLVLTLATLTLWMRSYWYCDYLYHTACSPTGDTTRGVLLSRGIFQLDWFANSGLHSFRPSSEHWQCGNAGPWDWGSIYTGDPIGTVLLELWVPQGGTAPRQPDVSFAGLGYGTETHPFIGLYSGERPPDRVCRFVTVPAWSVLLLSSILPLRSGVLRYRHARRLRLARCPSCGYNLFATPERCPECGAVAQSMGRQARFERTAASRVLVLGAVALLTLCGCASETRAPLSQTHSSHPNRIWLGVGEVYEAEVVIFGAARKLVITRRPQDLFGTVFDVELRNEAGAIVRQGCVVAIEGDIPYCLVEVKADSESLPAGVRDQWMLAVGFWPREQPYVEGKPVYLVPWEGAQPNAAFIYAEPIDWSDDDGVFDRGAGRLADVSCLKARFAERGRSPLKNVPSNGGETGT